MPGLRAIAKANFAMAQRLCVPAGRPEPFGGEKAPARGDKTGAGPGHIGSLKRVGLETQVYT